MLELFKIFFALGWVSFGGPAAHIGYFRRTFVEKRQWLSDDEYAQLIALSQFLPGPGSSQIGFAIGYQKHGIVGGLLAFVGFTLPSILLMILIASLSQHLLSSSWMQGLIAGLKLLAVVVVCDATFTMFKQFCQNKLHQGLCIATACVCLLFPSAASQILCLAIAALLCHFLNLKNQTTHLATSDKYIGSKVTQTPFSRSSKLALTGFVCLFALLMLWPNTNQWLGLFKDFYITGSLVFGGGHVVLPLLQSSVGEQLTSDAFVPGYADAQAMPGPMFTFATYLGYLLMPTHPITGAIAATVAIFLPGFLLVIGLLKQWQHITQQSSVLPIVAGVNAAVVGLLLAALYQPIFTSAVHNSLDFAALLIGLLILRSLKLPMVWLVMIFAVFGIVVGL